MAPASGGPGGDLRWRSSLRLEPATTQTAKCIAIRPRESHPRFAGKEKKLYFRKIVAKTKILRNEKI